MRILPKPCVLDASIGVKLFIPQERSDSVQRLFEEEQKSDSPSLFVPDLFFIECANVLWKKVRQGKVSEADAVRDLADLRALGLPTTPTSDLMERAFRLACQCGISAYDGCYAALAEQRDIPLLTADERLVRLLANTGVRVMSLGT